MSKGYVSMRNEDGTQWLTVVEGGCFWGDYAERSLVSEEVYQHIDAMVELSRANDCPDNGFFGIYNLKFTQKT